MAYGIPSYGARSYGGTILYYGTLTYMTDGVVKATETLGFTTDAILAQSINVDGVVKVTQTITYTADGVVETNPRVSVTSDAVVLVHSSDPFTVDGIVNNQPFTNKKFYYKVYDKNGAFLNTWSSEVTNDPTFKASINGGLGQLNIKLARNFNSVDENNPSRDINFRNRVELWIQDREAPHGVKIYSGFISDYSPYIDGTNEYVLVSCFGYVSDLATVDLVDLSNNVAVAFPNSLASVADPGAIISAVVYLANVAGSSVTSGTIDNVGYSTPYTFNNVKTADAINKTKSFCPANYYWYVDQDNRLNAHIANTSTPDLKWAIGREILKIDSNKTMRQVINSVKFIGGNIPNSDASKIVQLLMQYSDSTSISTYGRRSTVVVDYNVIDWNTALKIMLNIVNTQKDAQARATVEVVDSNGDSWYGCDIESLQPGQTVQILDPKENNPASQPYSLTQALIIQSVEYQFDKAIVELSIRPPWLPLTNRAIQQQMIANAVATAPGSPTIDNTGTYLPPSATVPDNLNNVVINGTNQKGGFTVLSGKFNLQGASGNFGVGSATFTTSDGHTVTVENGVITSFV